MLRERLAVWTAACVLVAPGARAAEPTPAAAAPTTGAPSAGESAPSFADRFFRGTSPGELPTGKLAVVATLYAGAATSVGVGVGALFSAGAKHDDAEQLKESLPRGFCNDLASSGCATYRRALAAERSRRETGFLLLGLGGLLALGGGLTAELWQNDDVPRVALDIGPAQVSLGVSGAF